MFKYLSGLTAAWLCIIPAVAWAVPSAFDNRFSSLENQLQKSRNDFTTRLDVNGNKNIDSRLAEGISMQSVGDHQRASYIFMDILSRDDWKSSPVYQTARLLLARSLYESGYYRLSEKHLIDLLQYGSGRERTDGVMLLLQVAQKTGDWAEVNNALTSVNEFSRTPAYLYIMGRAMFLQDDLDTAKMSLQSVNTQDEWMDKATYLLGVIDVQTNNFDDALQKFERVASSTCSYKGSDFVHELATLARARIFFERTQWSEAINEYQKIPETSSNFPAVLYELGWTQIRMADYVNAQQSFELLLLSFPNDKHSLQTQRLLADIKREQGKYDEAIASYQNIVNEFDPVIKKMNTEAGEVEQRKINIKKSIEEERYNDAKIVPERAKGLIAIGSDVGKLETMLDDLSTSDNNTIESERIAAEINDALNNEGNIQNLPEFQAFTQTIREIRVNTLILGFDFTKDNTNAPDTLYALVDNVADLPRTRLERDIMTAMQQSAREERDARLHHLKLQSASMEQRAKILDNWLNSSQTDSFSPEERERLKQQINLFEKQIENLKKQQQKIEAKLIDIRIRNGESAEQSNIARRNLDDLENALQSQWQADLQTNNISTDYRQMIERSRTLISNIHAFDSQIADKMRERTNEFKRRLAQEVELLNAEKSRYVTAKTDVGDTAGDISAKYWQSVYDQVQEMVLYADLGMVDIAWLQKDARSKELQATLEERKKEREVLEQDFRQFLKESGKEE